MSITIVLADDHAILREGLRGLLEGEPDLQVIGQASTGTEAIELVRKHAPNVVIMDVGMPDLNGIEATIRILKIDPLIKVVSLSASSDKRVVLAMLDAGAVAYLPKDCAADELLTAIRAVMKNHKYLSPSVVATVVDSYTGRPYLEQSSARLILSDREREVLQRLAEGKTSRQIAAALDISESTVDVHRRNIMQKLDLHTIAELTKYAIREGLTNA